ncbi:hypothetical protein [Geodermatophilus poikilotrophus]|uniref:hypothetical protein n=1 Tax=Geodermatophilus poikilotrophus TaxID=1333667 RepID=UPI001C317505|nr:hypothetical protein [Geodermatophilus poikilotrophus]
MDDRAAELNQLPDREQYQETDQPRGREDLCHDAPEHLANEVAGSHVRFRGESAHARLNGVAEGGLEFRRTIGRISRQRSTARSG